MIEQALLEFASACKQEGGEVLEVVFSNGLFDQLWMDVFSKNRMPRLEPLHQDGHLELRYPGGALKINRKTPYGEV